MDAELGELARAFEADPADAEVARRYDVALLRAGRRAELEARLLAKYVCPVRWEETIGRSYVNWCTRCEEVVRAPSSLDVVGLETVRSRGHGVCVGGRAQHLETLLSWLIEHPEVHSAQESDVLRVHLVTKDRSELDDMEGVSDWLPEALLAAHGLEAFVLEGVERAHHEGTQYVAELDPDLATPVRRLLTIAHTVCHEGRRPALLLSATRSTITPPPPAPPGVLGWWAWDRSRTAHLLLDLAGNEIPTAYQDHDAVVRLLAAFVASVDGGPPV